MTKIIYSVISIFLFLECFASIEVNFKSATPEYGVDCSFPIHYGIDKAKCPWWHDSYQRLMKGCYSYWSKEECDSNEADRLRMNLQQARTQHNYTTLGFKKIRAPKEAWEPLIKFYNDNKAKAQVEKWYHGSTVVNMWESPSSMVSFENSAFRGGWSVKQQIWDGVKPIIEEWVGHEIEPTSLYGIRLYSGGSVLATHLDRLPLISSCIINVDQDVDEPWPIEVYDHSGRAYNITMAPGDLVLYESSTVLHGRPFPMKGRHYANIFVHFKPLVHDKLNELDAQARELEEKDLQSEPLSVRRRHSGSGGDSSPSMMKRSLRNTPSLNTMTKADINTEREELFRSAASHGNLQLVQSMLQKDPTLLYAADANDWLAMHEAIRGGRTEVVKYLIDEKGADPNWKVRGGGGALWLARQYLSADHEIIPYLLNIGAADEDF